MSEDLVRMLSRREVASIESVCERWMGSELVPQL